MDDVLYGRRLYITVEMATSICTDPIHGLTVHYLRGYLRMRNFLVGIVIFLAIGMVANLISSPKSKHSGTSAGASDSDDYYGGVVNSLDATKAKIAAAKQATRSSSVNASQWRTRTGKSAIDDSESIYLTLSSSNLIVGRYRGTGPAEIQIRCLENTTAMTLSFNDHFMADIQGYGNVTYRIDKRKAKTRKFRESTDNRVLGLWRGGQSIPFVKEMFGGEEMVIRATPFNESTIEAHFMIEGLEDKIGPLRKACHW